jgi:hypothetical protein
MAIYWTPAIGLSDFQSPSLLSVGLGGGEVGQVTRRILSDYSTPSGGNCPPFEGNMWVDTTSS